MRLWARAEFLSLLAAEYPRAFASRSLWLLLLYLCLGWRTSREGHLELSYPTLAALAGQLTPRVLARETFPPGRRMLRDLQEVIGRDEAGLYRFTVRGHRAGERPRTVARLEFPSHVQRAVDGERLKGPARGAERVHILTGLPVRSPRHNVAVRKANRVAAETAVVEVPPRGRTLEVAEVLSATPSNTVARLVAENGPAAGRYVQARYEREAVLAQTTGSARQARKARRRHDHDTRVLAQVAEDPTVRYEAAPNSPRLFVAGGHLGSLTAGTRRVLLRGLAELDLKAAQLATLCVVLRLPLTNAMLQAGTSPWVSVAAALNLDTRSATWPQVKRAIKNEGLYPAAYGRPVPWLKVRLDWAVGDALGVDGRACGFGERFVEIAWVNELLDARDEALAEVDRCGGVATHHGEFVALPGRAGDHVLGEGATAKTALVYAASALELHVIGAAVDLQAAESARRFRIELLQHDGFSLRVVDRRRRGGVLRDVTAAVDARAAELGVPTRLVPVSETLV